MRVDAHQHFWDMARGDYGWLTPDLKPIYRSFKPWNLIPHLKAHHIDRTILVQAAPTMAETEYLLSIAQRNRFVAGVVGWLDFLSPSVLSDIERYCGNTALLGVRPMIQDIPDREWMLRTELTPVFNALADNGLTFDALVMPQHLGNLSRLLGRHPELRCVIDHAGKPEIRAGHFTRWKKDMAILARYTNCFCKLSGLLTEARPGATIDDIRPYAETALELFGADRLMWGSDWPVLNLASDYANWYEMSLSLTRSLVAECDDAVFGGTAARFYQLTEAG